MQWRDAWSGQGQVYRCPLSKEVLDQACVAGPNGPQQECKPTVLAERWRIGIAASLNPPFHHVPLAALASVDHFRWNAGDI